MKSHETLYKIRSLEKMIIRLFIDEKEFIPEQCNLKKQSANLDEIDLNKWYEFFNIEEYKNIKFKNLSLGTKQKVGLIQAFMHEPQNILLDEPFNALDKENIQVVQEYLIKKRKEGKLIIIVTHINDDILNKCDEVLQISEGKIL